MIITEVKEQILSHKHETDMVIRGENKKNSDT